jgi:hypothetical protein
MPTYRSITLSLVSQLGILTIPEYPPPPTTSPDPFFAGNAPTLLNSDESLVSVYIPTYPCSRFWLAYSISPPYPPNAVYYFKLFINGRHVVSWGCGKADGYKGKTMFGLYDAGENRKGRSCIERRAFSFADDDIRKIGAGVSAEEDMMEVRVFRSKGRKRIRPEVVAFAPQLPKPPVSKSVGVE